MPQTSTLGIMMIPSSLVAALVALVLVNGGVTIWLFNRNRQKRLLSVAMIWLFPFIGAVLVLIVNGPPGVSPHPIGGERNPPGIGGS